MACFTPLSPIVLTRQLGDAGRRPPAPRGRGVGPVASFSSRRTGYSPAPGPGPSAAQQRVVLPLRARLARRRGGGVAHPCVGRRATCCISTSGRHSALLPCAAPRLPRTPRPSARGMDTVSAERACRPSSAAGGSHGDRANGRRRRGARLARDAPEASLAGPLRTAHGPRRQLDGARRVHWSLLAGGRDGTMRRG